MVILTIMTCCGKGYPLSASPADKQVMTTFDNTNEIIRPTRREDLSFSGTGGEYFGIWIINILLTALTLGIYSAWAKVRRTRFFYRNTRLAGAGFDYHANPWAILKGRMIAAALIGSYYAAALFSPIAGGVAFVALLGLAPWLISRALRFRLYNTSYRGLRFRFTGSTADAYKVFLLLPLGTVMTLGALGPMWHQRMKSYVHSSAWYGQTPFSFDATIGSFYRVYFAALGLVVAFGVGGLLLVAPFLFGGLASEGPASAAAFTIAIIFAIVTYVSASLTLWAFTSSRIQNLAWNNTQLGPHRFASSVGARRLAWITVTNLLGVILTLGFYKPFAVVRLTEYLLGQSTAIVSGNLNDFVAGEQQAVGAAGEEAVEMFDLDFAV
jgi:uncharacterized membrane protein YjgN (DUF898 family)